jgi:hypothetical protein
MPTRTPAFKTGLYLLLCGTLSACFSPVAVDHLAVAYNESTANVLSEQLLLNIARARYNEPIHFSGISNIAATLNFQASAGMTPALAGGNGALLMPLIGGAVSENPTISIVPIDGEEFTKRMLTPITEDKLTLLLRQNINVHLLLRLVALEFRTNDSNVFHNRPRNAEDYAEFRRIAMHLAYIQHKDQLYAEPLIFEKRWHMPLEKLSGEAFQKLEKEYSIQIDAPNKQYLLSKQMVGRNVLTNYDPADLSNEERARLNEEAEKNSINDLLVDIRPGFPGGELPIHGKFRLRSFSNIMYFIGRSLDAEPEYSVAPDARTPEVAENPISVLSISASDTAPDNERVNVFYRNQYYSLANSAQADWWNPVAFRVLSQVYQMTVTDLPKSGVPSITIAK